MYDLNERKLLKQFSQQALHTMRIKRIRRNTHLKLECSLIEHQLTHQASQATRFFFLISDHYRPGKLAATCHFRRLVLHLSYNHGQLQTARNTINTSISRIFPRLYYHFSVTLCFCPVSFCPRFFNTRRPPLRSGVSLCQIIRYSINNCGASLRLSARSRFSISTLIYLILYSVSS